MEERTKKVMMSFIWQCVICASLFLIMIALKRVMPEVFNKLSAIWTKSTDLKKTGGLLIKLFKEIIPF